MSEELKRDMMEYLCQAHMSGQRDAGCMEPSYSSARVGVKDEYECVIAEFDKINTRQLSEAVNEVDELIRVLDMRHEKAITRVHGMWVRSQLTKIRSALNQINQPQTKLPTKRINRMKNKTIQILAEGDHVLPIGTKYKLRHSDGSIAQQYTLECDETIQAKNMIHEVDFSELPPLYPEPNMEVPENGIPFIDGVHNLYDVGKNGITYYSKVNGDFYFDRYSDKLKTKQWALERVLPQIIQACAECHKEVCECVSEINERVDEILKHITIGRRNTLTYIDGTGYSLESSSACLDGYSGEYKKVYLNIFQEDGENKRVKATTDDFDVIQGKIVDCKLGDLFVLNDSDLSKITFPEGILIIGFRDETYVNANYLFGNCVCYRKHGLNGHEGIILRRKN